MLTATLLGAAACVLGVSACTEGRPQTALEPDVQAAPVSPPSRIWTLTTNSMAEARFHHGAAALGSGRALVCAGRSDLSTYSRSCDVYSGGAFTPAAALPSGRAFLTLTPTPSGEVIAVGGANDDVARALDAVLGYTWSAQGGQWTSRTALGTSRYRHETSFIASTGSLLVTGGLTTDDTHLQNDEIGDASAWSNVASGSSRWGHTATELASGNQVLVVGGNRVINAGAEQLWLDTVRLFTQPAQGAGSYQNLRSLGANRSGHTATLIPGDPRVLIFGGRSDASTYLDSAVFYTATSGGTVTPAGNAAPGRAFHAAATLDGKIIVTGGLTADGAITQVDVFDPKLPGWYSLDAMNVARYSHTLTVLDDESLLVAGGRDSAGLGLDTAEVLKPLGLGEACDPTRRECLSGNCIDGVCCDTACDGTCQRCDDSGICRTDVTGPPVGEREACADGYQCEKGACLSSCKQDSQCQDPFYCTGVECSPRQGRPSRCERDRQCRVGSYCVDGQCCDARCDGQCETCSKVGSEGTCTATVEGPPVGIRPQCGSGDCDLRCDGVHRDRCYPTTAGRPCGADGCVENQWVVSGTCDGAGLCSADPPHDCGRYLCEATEGGCASACTSSAQCSPGSICEKPECVRQPGLGDPCTSDRDCPENLVCEDDDQLCCTEQCDPGWSCTVESGTCRGDLGTECTFDAHCNSGFCADGVCCDSACTGQCEACNSTGVCGPVTGPPVPGRPRCDEAADVCGELQCDGVAEHRDSCKGFVHGPKTSCREATCSGNRFVPAGACSGFGVCSETDSVSCGDYLCTPSGCPESCSKNEQCVVGASCANGKCSTGPHCINDNTQVDDGAGVITDCGDYRCVAGACLQTCASTGDCATRRVCNLQSRCVSDAPSAGEDDDGCGCRVAGSGGRKSGPVAPLFLAAFALFGSLRRQRSSVRARSSASTTLPIAKR